MQGYEGGQPAAPRTRPCPIPQTLSGTLSAQGPPFLVSVIRSRGWGASPAAGPPQAPGGPWPSFPAAPPQGPHPWHPCPPDPELSLVSLTPTVRLPPGKPVGSPTAGPVLGPSGDTQGPSVGASVLTEAPQQQRGEGPGGQAAGQEQVENFFPPSAPSRQPGAGRDPECPPRVLGRNRSTQITNLQRTICKN